MRQVLHSSPGATWTLGRLRPSAGTISTGQATIAGTDGREEGTAMYDAMMAETISITGHGGDQIEAYPAPPLGPGPFRGVVGVHPKPGFAPETQEITRAFAV